MDILIFLSNNRTINTAKELSAFLGISKGLVARGIKSLLLKGYVYIETDNSDRRIQHLFLTEAAQEVIQVLLKKRSEVEAHILKGIPQEHINIVLQTFDRINANIENIIETNEHTLEE